MELEGSSLVQINCSIVCSTSQTLEFNRDLKVKLEIIVGSIFVFRSQSDFAIFFFWQIVITRITER